MASQQHFPKQGDLIWIDAEPHAGHEYGGHEPTNNIRRPMLVTSSESYNRITGMVAGFPITSQIPADFPTALKIKTAKIQGYAVLSSLLGYDFDARHGEVVAQVDRVTRMNALAAVQTIFAIY